jgi:hypothetical protein
MALKLGQFGGLGGAPTVCAIVGASCTGKTTFARHLMNGKPHDDVHVVNGYPPGRGEWDEFACLPPDEATLRDTLVTLSENKDRSALLVVDNCGQNYFKTPTWRGVAGASGFSVLVIVQECFDLRPAFLKACDYIFMIGRVDLSVDQVCRNYGLPAVPPHLCNRRQLEVTAACASGLTCTNAPDPRRGARPGMSVPITNAAEAAPFDRHYHKYPGQLSNIRVNGLAAATRTKVKHVLQHIRGYVGYPLFAHH